MKRSNFQDEITHPWQLRGYNIYIFLQQVEDSISALYSEINKSVDSPPPPQPPATTPSLATETSGGELWWNAWQVVVVVVVVVEFGAADKFLEDSTFVSVMEQGLEFYDMESLWNRGLVIFAGYISAWCIHSMSCCEKLLYSKLVRNKPLCLFPPRCTQIEGNETDR